MVTNHLLTGMILQGVRAWTMGTKVGPLTDRYKWSEIYEIYNPYKWLKNKGGNWSYNPYKWSYI